MQKGILCCCQVMVILRYTFLYLNSIENVVYVKILCCNLNGGCWISWKITNSTKFLCVYPAFWRQRHDFDLSCYWSFVLIILSWFTSGSGEPKSDVQCFGLRMQCLLYILYYFCLICLSEEFAFIVKLALDRFNSWLNEV